MARRDRLEKPLGREPKRLGEETIVTMDDPLTDEDDGSRRHALRSDRRSGLRLTRQNPDRRIETHRFGEHGARVPEPLVAIGRRQRGARDGFIGEAFRDVGTLRDEQDGKCERVCDRLVPGQQKRHAFVPHLPPPRRPAARPQQPAGDAAGSSVRRGDQPADDLVEVRHTATKAAHRRKREAQELVGPGEKDRVHHQHERVDRLCDPAGVIAQIGAEQRAADDVEREPQHFGPDIDRLAVTPARERPCRLLDGVGVRRQALSVKQRLQRAALIGVQRLLGRQEPAAHHGARALHQRSPEMIAGVGDEQLANEIGMVDLIRQPSAEPKRSDVAESARVRRDELQRSAAEPDYLAHAERRAGTVSRDDRHSNPHRR